MSRRHLPLIWSHGLAQTAKRFLSFPSACTRYCQTQNLICIKMLLIFLVNILMQLHCPMGHRQETRLVCKAHLDFHGNFFPIFQACQVNLTNWSSSKGSFFKGLQFIPPVGAKIIVESFLQTEKAPGFEKQRFKIFPTENHVPLMCLTQPIVVWVLHSAF